MGHRKNNPIAKDKIPGQDMVRKYVKWILTNRTFSANDPGSHISIQQGDAYSIRIVELNLESNQDS